MCDLLGPVSSEARSVSKTGSSLVHHSGRAWLLVSREVPSQRPLKNQVVSAVSCLVCW